MTHLGVSLRVISGGQTGADQGGLMAARERNIPTGGWAPKGYRTSTGPNPLLEDFGLKQTKTADFSERTRLNVQESDVTAIFGFDLTSPGSRLTRSLAQELGRPCFLFILGTGPTGPSDELRQLETLLSFILLHRPSVINIAGNRDTQPDCPVYHATRRVVGQLLDLLEEARENGEW